MLRMTTSVDDIERFFNRALEYIEKCFCEALSDLVREADEKARSRTWYESFHDITGNLRSSIGGGVFHNGQVFFETAFEQVLNGSKGSTEGRRRVHELATMYRDSVVFTMVAAMDYATHVEAIESKDVLESTRIWAEAQVEARLKAARDKAVKEINTWKL